MEGLLRRLMDDFQLGQLTQEVRTLAKKVDGMDQDLKEIKSQVNKGKGFAFGLLAAAGGVGAAISTAVHRIFGS